MRPDQPTEDIWHFIGLFGLVFEQARAAILFDSFAIGDTTPDPVALRHVPIDIRTLTSPPALPGKTPVDLDRDAVDGSLAAPLSPLPDSSPPEPVVGAIPGAIDPALLPLVFTGGLVFDGIAWAMRMTPPGSVAVVITQNNLLGDDDVVALADFGAVFHGPRAADATLDALVKLAADLNPLRSFAPPADTWALKEIAVDMLLDARAVPMSTAPGDDSLPEATLSDGLGMHAFRGEAAYGERVDGAAAPAPIDDITEALEELTSDTVRDAQETPRPVADATDRALDAPHDLAERITEKTDSGVNLGENTLLNDAKLLEAWIEAPVFAVMGDNLVLDVITQTNVIASGGRVGHRTEGPDVEDIAALTGNFARLSRGTRPEPTEDAAPPMATAVATLDADLISVSWLEQSNILSDDDIASVTTSGRSVYLNTGDNLLVNAGDILTAGFAYDLVVIDGDRVDVAAVSQTNVLLDVNAVTAPADVATGVMAGDNLVWNLATIDRDAAERQEAMPAAFEDYAEALQSDPRAAAPEAVSHDAHFAGGEVLRVLHVKGSMISVQYVSQTNILSDVDQLATDARILSPLNPLETGSSLVPSAEVSDLPADYEGAGAAPVSDGQAPLDGAGPLGPSAAVQPDAAGTPLSSQAASTIENPARSAPVGASATPAETTAAEAAVASPRQTAATPEAASAAVETVAGDPAAPSGDAAEPVSTDPAAAPEAPTPAAAEATVPAASQGVSAPASDDVSHPSLPPAALSGVLATAETVVTESVDQGRQVPVAPSAESAGPSLTVAPGSPDSDSTADRALASDKTDHANAVSLTPAVPPSSGPALNPEIAAEDAPIAVAKPAMQAAASSEASPDQQAQTARTAPQPATGQSVTAAATAIGQDKPAEPEPPVPGAPAQTSVASAETSTAVIPPEHGTADGADAQEPDDLETELPALASEPPSSPSGGEPAPALDSLKADVAETETGFADVTAARKDAAAEALAQAEADMAAAAEAALDHAGAQRTDAETALEAARTQQQAAQAAAEAEAMQAEAAAAAELDALRLEMSDNILINLAAIEKVGGAETVYVKGAIYSDALLHQARFIAADAESALNSGPPPLVSEALAFLAEGMIAAPEDAAEHPSIKGYAYDAPPLDVMQTMLG